MTTVISMTTGKSFWRGAAVNAGCGWNVCFCAINYRFYVLYNNSRKERGFFVMGGILLWQYRREVQCWDFFSSVSGEELEEVEEGQTEGGV